MASSVIEKSRKPPTKLPSLWRNRDYMLLWSGQVISTIGSGVTQIAFPFLVLYLTNSPLQAGIAGALRALPYVFFSLPAGALIDRWNRKIVMIICDSGRAIALGSIPVALFFNVLTIWQVFVVAFIEGTLFVLFDIAEVSCLPRVVGKEQLAAATAQNQSTFGIAFLLAPPLGGFLYNLRVMLPFVADSVSYVVSVISLFAIKTKFQAERTPLTERHLGREIREGITWLWGQPLIRYIAFLTGGINFVGSGSMIIILIIVKNQGGSSISFGLVTGIASIGGIIGAIIGGFVQKRFTFAQVIIGTTWIQAIAWPFLAIAPNYWFISLISGIMFLTGPIYNVVQFSYRLSLIPDALQGRVNSVFRLLAFGFLPVGLAVAGALVQWVGAIDTVLIFGVVNLLLAVMTNLNTHVRHARPTASLEVAS